MKTKRNVRNSKLKNKTNRKGKKTTKYSARKLILQEKTTPRTFYDTKSKNDLLFILLIN